MLNMNIMRLLAQEQLRGDLYKTIISLYLIKLFT